MSDEDSARMDLPPYPAAAAPAPPAAPAIVPKPGIDKRLKPAARQQAQLQAEIAAYEAAVRDRKLREAANAA